VDDHFSDWFPDLPSYQSCNRRLNRLNAVFPPLVERALEQIDSEETRAIMLRIADSMPIMFDANYDGERTESHPSDGGR